MKKLCKESRIGFVFIMTLLWLSNGILAQDSVSVKKMRFGINSALILPGTNLKGYGLGFGGEAMGYFPLSNDFWFTGSAGLIHFGENSQTYGVDVEGERKRTMLQIGGGLFYQSGNFFISPMAFYVYSFETIEFNQVQENRLKDLIGVRLEGGIVIQDIRISLEYNAIARPSGSFGSKVEGWYGLRVGFLF